MQEFSASATDDLSVAESAAKSRSRPPAPVAMTDRFVAGAKRDAHRAEFFDAIIKGLSLRIAKDGRKTWSYLFSLPHERARARVGLGSYPATSLAAARARAMEAKTHVEAGKDPRHEFAAQAAGAMTVAGLIVSYLEKHVRPSLRSAAAIERRFTKNVLPLIGSVRVADLHRRDINRIVDPILACGRPVEAARVFEDLRAALRWGVARGDLDRNPIDGMNKPGGAKPRERALSDAEILTLWRGLPTSLPRSTQIQRIIRLCLITGQRVGEVAGMTRGELDLDGRRWLLPGARTKNGADHLVPLSALALAVIDEALEAARDSKFVFPCGDGSLRGHAVARTIGRAHEASEGKPLGRFEISKWTAHDLRRTVLTNFAQLGIAPIVAAAVANHRSVTKATITLSVYTRYDYEKEKREALDRWAERLEAICAEDAGQNVVSLHRARHAS